MSFRKYGGTQFASSHNIVKSNVNTTDSFYVTQNVGQPNTYINFESDISGNMNIYGNLDVSGNLSVSGDVDINGKLHVQENIDCSGNVNIDGDVDINGKLHVQEDIDCSGNVTAEYMFLTSGLNYTTATNGVVPKSYVDSVANGLTPLPPCVLCSNAGPITLSGYGQTIDGVTITSITPTTSVYDGSFVLINAQGYTTGPPAINSPAITNGVYIVSSGTWSRAPFLITGDKATGTATLILQGTTYANYRFVCTTGSNTSQALIGTAAVLWSQFEIPYSLGQGLSKYNNGGNTVIQVDSSLNFINFLDNYAAGPNAGTMNIGTYTNTINIGLNTTSALSNYINLGMGSSGSQLSYLNWGTVSNSGQLTFRGGSFNLYSSGVYTQTSGNGYDTNIDGNASTKTTGNINIGTGNSLTGAINLGTGTGAKPITIGSTASTVAINGATTVTGTTTITGGITAFGLITANAGILTNTLHSTGVIYIDGLINANAGMITGSGTTITSNGPITSSGLITANTLTASGLITADAGITVNNVLITANAGIGTTTLTASGLITANTLTASGLITADAGITVNNALITANAGIGTTTLTASGVITANTLTASGLITANAGLNVVGSLTLYNGSNNSVISENGSNLNLINNNTGGNVVISNSTYNTNNFNFGFDSNGNTLTFNADGSSDTGFIRWYSPNNTNSYLQIGTTDDTTYNQEQIYFTQFQENIPNPGTTYVRMRIDTNGVWINPSGDTYFTTASTYSLNVNGAVNATSYNSASDYRIKKDVVTLDETFTVDKLRPVTYNNTKLDKQDIGLIAHEVQEIYPFLVTGEKDGENLQSVNYTGLIGILIKEIQDLKERVKKLEEK
jgi:cytoskeletal protein CcmA (bactofilin family)